MTEHNLPDKDDAPWLNCMDGFQVEGLTRCNCRDRNSMTKPLSSAAQAVHDAAFSAYWSPEQGLSDAHVIAAAALRAAADQVAPFPGRYPMNEYMEGCRNAKQNVHYQLLSIADELEQEGQFVEDD